MKASDYYDENPFIRARAIWLPPQLGTKWRKQKTLYSIENTRVVAFRACYRYWIYARSTTAKRSLFICVRNVALSADCPLKKQTRFAGVDKNNMMEKIAVLAVGAALSGHEEEIYPSQNHVCGKETAEVVNEMIVLAWRGSPKRYITGIVNA